MNPMSVKDATLTATVLPGMSMEQVRAAVRRFPGLLMYNTDTLDEKYAALTDYLGAGAHRWMCTLWMYTPPITTTQTSMQSLRFPRILATRCPSASCPAPPTYTPWASRCRVACRCVLARDCTISHDNPNTQTYDQLVAERDMTPGAAPPSSANRINWNMLSLPDDKFAVHIASTPSARYREFLASFDPGALPAPVPQPAVDDEMLQQCWAREARRARRKVVA